VDIENELGYYKNHFKNKIVFCNCDDPKESNFWKYFALKFNQLKLKGLISTHFEKKKQSYKLEIKREDNDINNSIGYKNNKVTGLNIKKTTLKQNGDFRSPECIDILKESDIVVTNPPFSLFREYVAQLVEYDKKFIIIGNQNAITYKEIFKLIKENKIWLGFGFNGGATHFINKYYKDYATAGNHKDGMIRVSGVVWFTNLDIKKRHEDLILYKIYKGNEKSYPKYDNYDAIEVSKTKDIPCDWDGIIGVPITFMDKYNPDQFEIVGGSDRGGDNIPGVDAIRLTDKKTDSCLINGKKVYKRLFIKKKINKEKIK
jgi:hypothetical protein